MKIMSIMIPANQMEVTGQNQLKRLNLKPKEITKELYLVVFGMELLRLLRKLYCKESTQRRQ